MMSSTKQSNDLYISLFLHIMPITDEVVPIFLIFFTKPQGLFIYLKTMYIIQNMVDAEKKMFTSHPTPR
jgi:hypothetical protein